MTNVILSPPQAGEESLFAYEKEILHFAALRSE